MTFDQNYHTTRKGPASTNILINHWVKYPNLEIITCRVVKDLKLDVLVKKITFGWKTKNWNLLKVSSFRQLSKFQVFEDLIKEKCHALFFIKKNGGG